MINISNGNMKLGQIPNISFTPGVSCRPNTPCVKKCYAMKAYRLYRNVKHNWDENLQEYITNPTNFFNQITKFLQDNKPARFRWFVGGDMPDEEFFERMKSVCRKTQYTHHLIFTKRYDLDLNISDIPKNLHLFLSEWPGLTIPEKYKSLRVAHYRTPIGHECPGKCPGCLFCFDSESGDVFFHKH